MQEVSRQVDRGGLALCDCWLRGTCCHEASQRCTLSTGVGRSTLQVEIAKISRSSLIHNLAWIV